MNVAWNPGGATGPIPLILSTAIGTPTDPTNLVYTAVNFTVLASAGAFTIPPYALLALPSVGGGGLLIFGPGDLRPLASRGFFRERSGPRNCAGDVYACFDPKPERLQLAVRHGDCHHGCSFHSRLAIPSCVAFCSVRLCHRKCAVRVIRTSWLSILQERLELSRVTTLNEPRVRIVVLRQRNLASNREELPMRFVNHFGRNGNAGLQAGSRRQLI